MHKFIAICSILILFFACTPSSKQLPADKIFYNGTIYTADTLNPKVEAVAVYKGKIAFAGSLIEAKSYANDSTDMVDLKGFTMTPGFIESHGHLMGLGYGELILNLSDVKNYDDLVARVADAVAKASPGQWILGRGWHQSKWDKMPDDMVKGFQTHKKLSEVSPDNPVFLWHASGHAGFANAKAMELAGVNQLSVEQLTSELEGGEVIRDAHGNPTGIFSERAMGLISSHIPKSEGQQDEKALTLAIKACQANGITSFHDAGIGQKTIDLYQQFKNENKLGVRIYAMVSGPDRELTKNWLAKGPLIDTADNLLTIRAIKLNCDGALGNRGAWLLDDYSDMPGERGMPTLPMEYVLEVANKGLENGFQVCSHAIGDKANQEVLNQYEAAFKAHPNITNHRFRIEHAQHLAPSDIPRFAQLEVIASMQAIHLSSDRPWAIDRLGEKRIKEGAYMWQSLLASGAKVINGTDVPVEPINPIASFFASVTRQTLQHTPPGGYEPKEKMTRTQALKAYTLDAAYGEFSEQIKGSIEPGKLADFTVFSQDIMTIPDDELLDTVVEMTVLGGKVVYTKKAN